MRPSCTVILEAPNEIETHCHHSKGPYPCRQSPGSTFDRDDRPAFQDTPNLACHAAENFPRHHILCTAAVKGRVSRQPRKKQIDAKTGRRNHSHTPFPSFGGVPDDKARRQHKALLVKTGG
ncbi:hypothetical protein SDC9_86408 [bioreactor metagenome]|uniref:Uncharacterized protein n=1 Tax=bioreactor metagenome TaxID=1076179 RepID=A0A644ZM35_9ZZZZ